MRTGCLAGLCACLGGRLSAAGPAQSEAPPPATVAQKWIVAILPALAEVDKEQARRILKSGARAHFEALNMKAVADRFRGRLDEFLDFPRKEWGWIIDYDRERGVIEIDENKSACVCPLIPKDLPTDLGVLCSCSEGFAESLFSAVSGSPVRAEVTASIRRGQKSCRYRIELGPALSVTEPGCPRSASKTRRCD